MKRNLDLTQGVTTTIAVVARADDGDRLDLTSATIAWKLARHADAAAKISYAVGSGITVTNAAQGEFTITIAAADLDSLEGYYVHQCKITIGSAVYLAMQGSARVDGDID